MKSVERYILELNGYLSAVSHLSDQVGYRHGHYAKFFHLRNRDPLDLIKKWHGEQAVSNLTESNLRSERDLIRNYSLRNVAGIEELDSIKRRPTLSERICGTIQDYLCVDDYHDEVIEHRWISNFVDHGYSYNSIFLVTKTAIICLHFVEKREIKASGVRVDSER